MRAACHVAVGQLHAVVLPMSPPPPPPACCLSCCRRVVACRAMLWCCLPCHRCLCTACHVAVGQLHVMPHCGAAYVATATATCTLPVMLPSGGCVSCRAVVLPASPPPACCLSCCCWAVLCCKVLLPAPTLPPLGSCMSCGSVLLPAPPPPLLPH